LRSSAPSTTAGVPSSAQLPLSPWDIFRTEVVEAGLGDPKHLLVFKRKPQNDFCWLPSLETDLLSQRNWLPERQHTHQGWFEILEQNQIPSYEVMGPKSK
jgi:hypothetical protein